MYRCCGLGEHDVRRRNQQIRNQQIREAFCAAWLIMIGCTMNINCVTMQVYLLTFIASMQAMTRMVTFIFRMAVQQHLPAFTRQLCQLREICYRCTYRPFRPHARPMQLFIISLKRVPWQKPFFRLQLDSISVQQVYAPAPR